MKENNRVVFYLLWHILSGVIIASAFTAFMSSGSNAYQSGIFIVFLLFCGAIGVLILNCLLLINFSMLLHSLLMRLDKKDYKGTFRLQVVGTFAIAVFYLVILQGYAFYLFVPLAFECLIASLIDATIAERISRSQESQTAS